MSQVTLQVGGKAYPVSCADGEEDHVRRLAAVIDGKLTAMGSNLVPGDAQNLLFAALILADEVEEARSAAPHAPTSQRSSDTAAKSGSEIELAIASGLERIADRLEKLGRTLESGADNS